MIVETKPGQRYKACNVCRKRKIGCDGDGIHPCGPCLRFNENKSARTATFKFVNEDGDVECTYHETRFDVPKYMNASQAKKRTVSEVEEGNEPSPGKEEAEQLIELEGKLEDLQSVLHRMTFQHVVREGTWLPDAQDGDQSGFQLDAHLDSFVSPANSTIPSSTASSSHSSRHWQNFFLPPRQLARALVFEAFKSTFLLSDILSLQSVLALVEHAPRLTLSEAVVLHAMCLIGSFNMPWEDLKGRIGSFSPYLSPSSSSTSDSNSDVAECLAGNCCANFLYKKYVDGNDESMTEMALKGSIYDHHTNFINRHVTIDLQEMEDEEDGRGLERVAKACLLIAFYWSSRQYNLGQTWRVKTLRLCTMLGWNQSQRLARYSPLEQYQNSLVFWFTYVWDAYLSILVGDVPFLSLPSEDIQVPLPTKPLSKQTTVPSHRLTVTNAKFYDEEEPLKDLEPFQVMLKCGILTTKVADFWRRFDRGPTKDVNIAKVEVEEDFLALFQTCKNFQSSFPASLLAHLQSKPLASLSPSEVSARDSLYNSQLALSTAFILLHHRCIDPLAPDLYASFHLSGGAAQTALCMLPLYQQLLVERRQWSNPFYVIFGLAGKVLFRNLTILKHSKLGEADQTLRLEMTVFEAVRRMKEVARAWRGLSPSIIPLLRLMETPEICLSRGFDLMKVGRV